MHARLINYIIIFKKEEKVNTFYFHHLNKSVLECMYNRSWKIALQRSEWIDDLVSSYRVKSRFSSFFFSFCIRQVRTAYFYANFHLFSFDFSIRKGSNHRLQSSAMRVKHRLCFCKFFSSRRDRKLDGIYDWHDDELVRYFLRM